VKIGAENKKQVIWMTVLLAFAIPFTLYSFRDMLWSSGNPAAATPAAPSTGAQKAGSAVITVDSDPRLRLDILESSRKIKYEPGRNIFEMQTAPIEPAVASVRQPPDVHYGPDLPPPPPPPPPIPLKFYGFASKPGETKKIFLQQQNGEHMFVAVQGEVIDRRYKVVQIQANSVVMEDMLTNNRQPIPLTPR
jgi:hypothetical protein